VQELLDFLRAALDEDEQAAGDAAGLGVSRRHWTREAISCVVNATDSKLIVYGEGVPTPEQAEHIARWDPARVLAEVEAKQQRIEWLLSLEHDMGPEDFPTYDSCRLLVPPGALGDLEVGYCSCGLDAWRDKLFRFEALPYTEQDGYLPEWRPS
jgi:hypothetical protein